WRPTRWRSIETNLWPRVSCTKCNLLVLPQSTQSVDSPPLNNSLRHAAGVTPPSKREAASPNGGGAAEGGGRGSCSGDSLPQPPPVRGMGEGEWLFCTGGGRLFYISHFKGGFHPPLEPLCSKPGQSMPLGGARGATPPYKIYILEKIISPSRARAVPS